MSAGAPTRVLVTDGESRAALACVRALAASGHTVHVAAAGARSLAGASRFCARTHEVGDASLDPQRFAERLVAAAEQARADWVLPIGEVSLGSIYAFGVTERCRVACPERAAYEAAVDKHELLLRAARLGVRTPQTVLCEDPAQLSVLPGPFRYPVVLKARRSRFVQDGRWIAGEARIIDDATALQRARSQPGFAAGVLVQEFLPGRGEAIFLLTDRGRPIARFAHRRLREKPPWGGVSVLSEAIAPDPTLLGGSERLLGELGFTGAAMVEFRRTPDGEGFLMEVNPRFWGSLQLAIDSGVDFPSLVIALHSGQALPPEAKVQLGTRTRWLLGDVDHLLIALRHRNWQREQGLGAFGLLREFARSFFDGTRLEVLRRDDWRPFLQELRNRMRADQPASSDRLRQIE